MSRQRFGEQLEPREFSLHTEIVEQRASIVERDDRIATQETVLAESVGLALLVVLDTLAPAERISFVLHDLFAVSFDEIANIVGRSPAAVRQLASRARRRIQGADTASGTDLLQTST